MSTIAHLSLAEYDRMIERGVFDQGKRRRLEFIRGEIRQMTPIGSMHEAVVDRLTEWSIRSLLEGKVWVRVQNSIGLARLESAPEADLAWVVPCDPEGGRNHNLQTHGGDEDVRPSPMRDIALRPSMLWET